MIGGGALVATSVVFGAAAASKARQVEDRARVPGAIFDSGAKKIQDDGKGASAVAVATGLAGLAAGGVGLYLLLRSPAPEASASAAASSPSIFPLVGAGTWGAGAHVGF